MKNFNTWAIIGLIVAVLVLLKLFVFKNPDDQSKSQKMGGPAPVTCTAYIVTNESAKQEIYLSGMVSPYNEISLRSEIAGKIVQINFKDGDFVPQGKLLVKINDADFQAQLAKNNSQNKLASLKLDRLQKLKAIDGISQEELDVLENEIALLKSDAAFLMAQIAKTEIRAPFQGTLGIKQISPGAFVTNNDVITTLVQLNPLFIDFSVPEKYVGLVKKGMKINFQTESVEGVSMNHSAVIAAIDPTIEPNTKTLKCRAIYSGNYSLLSGAFVKVYVSFDNVKNALMVPTESIVPILKGQKLFVKKEGLAKEIKVITGVRTENKIQVLEGIQLGDTVITTGLLGIKNGLPLKVLKIQP